jgi:hypothetical protein
MHQMRYQLRNLGPGAYYCVERGKLLKVGDTVELNSIDYGTRRLGEGPNKRLEIVDRQEPLTPMAADGNAAPPPAATTASTSAPARAVETTPPTARASADRKTKDSAPSARGAALDVAPRAEAGDKGTAAAVTGDVIK